MAIPELLVADVFKTGSPPQVYELVGGTTLNPIGAALTVNAGENVIPFNESDPSNRCIEFRGQIYVAYIGAGSNLTIDSYNRGTGLWSSSLSRSNQFLCVGLYIANTGSGQRLFTFCRTGSAASELHYTDDGSSWTSTIVGANPTSSLLEGVPIMFNDRLYIPYFSGGGQVIEVDPVAVSQTLISGVWAPGGSTGSADLCVHDDVLYCLAMDANPAAVSEWALYEFTGSGWILNTQITSDTRNNISQALNGQCNLFKDPSTNNLIGLCNGTGAGGGMSNNNLGSTAFQLVPSGGVFTPTEITNTVVPAAYRPGARTGLSAYAEDRWYSVTVNDTTPGSPEAYLFFAEGPAPGTGYAVYAWTNASTLLASPAVGPSTAFSIPQTKFGGGARVNKGTGNQCAIESGEPVAAAYRISYRVYGTVASQTVRLYYSEDQETPVVQATISAQTGGGAISGGNSVTGVTGDDGSTLFTLDWNLGADGVTNGDSVHLMLDIR